MRYPLAGLTLLFCAGIFAANLINIPFVFVYSAAAAALILSALFLKKELKFKVSLICLLFFLGAALLKNHFILPKSHISRRIFYKADNHCRLKGFVSSPSVFRLDKTTFTVEAREAQFGNVNYSCCGKVLVRLKGRRDFNYGDAISLRGDLSRPFSRHSPSGKRYRNYLSGRGIYALMRIEREFLAAGLPGQQGGAAIKKFSLRLKNKIEKLLYKYMRPMPAAVLEAMLLGERKNIPPFIYQSMMKTGTVHILVVSGFNTSLVIFAVVLLLKIIRVPRRPRFFIALPILLVYCLMAGASTPVVRATIMAAAFMSSYFLRRQPDIYHSCAIAALFILFCDPAQLFDIGAQLSFVSVLSIACFYPKIKSFLRMQALKIKCLSFICEGFLVSFSAWMGTSAIVAYYFKIFSPVTVLANIFIVPLATFITLAGFSLVFIALLAPALAPFFASSVELAIALLLRLNSLLLRLPGACFYLP